MSGLNMSYEASQKIAVHSSTAAGKAITKPRAKLRRGNLSERTARTKVSFPGSNMATLLTFVAKKLPLSARQRQLLSGETGTNRGSDRLSREEDGVRNRIGSPRDWYLLSGLIGTWEAPRDAAIHRIIHLGSGRKRPSKPDLALRIALFLAVFSTPRAAMAEDPAVVTPIELFEPEASEGLRIGPGFILKPQAALDFTHDSNIYNLDTGKRSDQLVSLRPRLVLQSDFSRHMLQLQAGADVRRYFQTSGENSESFDASALAKLELGQRIDVLAQAGYLRGVEARGTAGDQFTSDSPIVYHQKNAKLGIARNGPRFGISVTGQVVRTDYSAAAVAGVPVGLGFRDVTVWSGVARTDFGLSPRTKLFAEAGLNKVDYAAPGVPSRNSDGFALLGGVHYEVSSLVDLEMAAGYIRQNFKNPLFSKVSGFNYRLAATWTPRPTWKVIAVADRAVEHSPLAAVPAIVKSSFRLAAQNALSDRLLAEAEAGRFVEDYSANPRRDRRWYAQGSLHYRLINQVGVIGTLGYRKQDGGAAGRSYSGLAASLGLRAAW